MGSQDRVRLPQTTAPLVKGDEFPILRPRGRPLASRPIPVCSNRTQKPAGPSGNAGALLERGHPLDQIGTTNGRVRSHRKSNIHTRLESLQPCVLTGCARISFQLPTARGLQRRREESDSQAEPFISRSRNTESQSDCTPSTHHPNNRSFVGNPPMPRF